MYAAVGEVEDESDRNISRGNFDDRNLRLKLRRENPEIRALEKSLRDVYLAKEQLDQIAAKRALRQKAQATELASSRYFEEAQLAAERLEDSVLHSRLESQKEYCKALQNQLRDRGKRQQEAYKQSVIEKQRVDEIVKRICDEDRRIWEQEISKRQQLKTELDAFKAGRKAFEDAEKQRLRVEEELIKKYAIEKEAKTAEHLDQKKRIRANFESIQDYIARDMEAKETARLELEEMRQTLAEEEALAKIREEETAEIKKKQHHQNELRADYQRQKEMKQLHLEAQRSEAEHYRDALNTWFAEEEAKAQQHAQKCALRKAEFKEAVEQMLADKRARVAAERERLRIASDEQRCLEKRERQIIEEEANALRTERARIRQTLFQ